MTIYASPEAVKSLQDDPLVLLAYSFDNTGRLADQPDAVEKLSFIKDKLYRLFNTPEAVAFTGYDEGLILTEGENNSYFIEYTLEPGIISISKDFSFYVTSLFDEDVTIDAFNVTAGDGVTVTSPSTGVTLYKNTSQEIVVNIEDQGKSIIDTTVEIVLSNGHSTTFYIQAIRTPLGWLFSVQWRDGLEYTRRFLTSVIESDSGAEYRKVLRQTPVREISIPVTVNGVTEQYFAQILLRNFTQSDQLIPVYQDKTSVTAPASAGDFTVYCDTTTHRFFAGGFASICKPGTVGGTFDFELLEIEEVFADRFTIVYQLGDDYTTAAFVYPMEEVVINPDGQTIEAFTDEVGHATINAVSKLTSTGLENPSYTPSTYDGEAVYPFRTNWVSGTAVQVTSQAMLEDSGRGQKAYAGYGRDYSMFDVTSFFATRDEYWEAIGFFNHLKGRGKPFFMAHPLNWLPLEQVIADDAFQLTDATFSLDLKNKLKYLYVSNGTQSQIVTVTDIYTSGTGETIVETTTPTISGITSITQALLVRLQNDDVSESWLTDGCVEVKFSVRELPEG